MTSRAREITTLRLLLAPRRREVGVDAERTRDHVVVALADNRREIQLEHPDDGRAVHHDLLHLVIVLAAPLEVRLDGGLVHQLIGYWITPLRAVHEHGALLDQLAVDGAMHAEHG